jgi:hypothetical protein
LAHTYSYEKMSQAHKRPGCELELVSNGVGWLYVHCKGCCFVAELESISAKGAIAFDYTPYQEAEAVLVEVVELRRRVDLLEAPK